MEPREFANAIANGTQRNYKRDARRAKIKRLAAITSAYTGYLVGDFSEMHKYIEKVMGRPVFTHEMGDQALMDLVQEAAKEDFIAAWQEALKE